MSTSQSLSKSVSTGTYDFLVVGGGITGLLIGVGLAGRGARVGLVDGAEALGGIHRGVSTPLGIQNNGWRFLPNTLLTREALLFLRDLLPSSVMGEREGERESGGREGGGEGTLVPTQVQVFDPQKGRMRPFTDFNDLPPPSYKKEISYFLESSGEVRPFVEVHQWGDLLFQQFQDLGGTFFPKSIVTRFVEEEEVRAEEESEKKSERGVEIGGGFGKGLERGFERGIEKGTEKGIGKEIHGKISSILINGQKKIRGHKFIFTGPPHQLIDLVPEKALGVRYRQKLKKNHWWMGIGLDLLSSLHSSPTLPDSEMRSEVNRREEAEGIFLIPSGSQDYFLGQFHKVSKEYSQWLGFVSSEYSEDAEYLGDFVRTMKKQIKKAFPERFNSILFERIVLVPSLSGWGELKLNADGALPNCPNLYVPRALAAPPPDQHLVGAILQAKKALHLLLPSVAEAEMNSISQQQPITTAVSSSFTPPTVM